MKLYVYIDNYALLLEGRRLAAVERGVSVVNKVNPTVEQPKVVATDIATAQKHNIYDMRWNVNYGALAELLVQELAPGAELATFATWLGVNKYLQPMQANIDEAPVTLTLYQRPYGTFDLHTPIAITVRLFEQVSNGEIDVTKDRIVLIAGNDYYLPLVTELQRLGLSPVIAGWRHAVSEALRKSDVQVFELDPYLESLGDGKKLAKPVPSAEQKKAKKKKKKAATPTKPGADIDGPADEQSAHAESEPSAEPEATSSIDA